MAKFLMPGVTFPKPRRPQTAEPVYIPNLVAEPGAPAYYAFGHEDLASELPQIPRRRSKRNKIRKPNQQRLIDIMKSLGKTQVQFAADLGIGHPRLASYVYGTTEVPAHILAAAEQLQAGELVQQEKAVQMHRQGVPMAEILAYWAGLAGVDLEDTQKIGIMCGGVSSSTISRWKRELTRPSVDSIRVIDDMVNTYIQKLKKMNDALGVKHAGNS